MKDFESWEKIYEESKIKGFSEWEDSAVNEGLAKEGMEIVTKGIKIIGQKLDKYLGKGLTKTLKAGGKLSKAGLETLGDAQKYLSSSFLKDFIDDVTFDKIKVISKDIDSIQDQDILKSLNDYWKSWLDEQSEFFTKTTKSKRTRLDIKSFNQNFEKELVKIEPQLKNISEIINEYNRLKDVIEELPGKSDFKSQLLKDLNKAKGDIKKAAKNINDLDTSDTLLSSAVSRLNDIVDSMPKKFAKKSIATTEEGLEKGSVSVVKNTSELDFKGFSEEQIVKKLKYAIDKGDKVQIEAIGEAYKKTGLIEQKKLENLITDLQEDAPKGQGFWAKMKEWWKGKSEKGKSEKVPAPPQDTKNVLKMIRKFFRIRRLVTLSTAAIIYKGFEGESKRSETGSNFKKSQENKERVEKLLETNNSDISLVSDYPFTGDPILEKKFLSENQNFWPTKDNLPNDLCIKVQSNKLIDILTILSLSSYRNAFTYYEEGSQVLKNDNSNILGYITKVNQKSPENIAYLYNYLLNNTYDESSFSKLNNNLSSTEFKKDVFCLYPDKNKSEISLLLEETPKFMDIFEKFKNAVFQDSLKNEMYSFLQNVNKISTSSDELKKMGVSQGAANYAKYMANNNIMASYGILITHLIDVKSENNPLTDGGKYSFGNWTTGELSSAVNGMNIIASSSGITIKSEILDKIFTFGLQMAFDYFSKERAEKSNSFIGMLGDTQQDAQRMQTIFALCAVNEFCSLISSKTTNESKKLLLNWNQILTYR